MSNNGLSLHVSREQTARAGSSDMVGGRREQRRASLSLGVLGVLVMLVVHDGLAGGRRGRGGQAAGTQHGTARAQRRAAGRVERPGADTLGPGPT